MIFAGKSLVAVVFFGFFASFPSSTNYTLKGYDVGGGGGSSSSTNYNLNGQTGTQTGTQQSSASYGVSGGELPTQHANVPPAPTLTNPSSSEYLRLKLVLNTGSNPSDVKFAIAISSDNFVTTKYVKSDNSMGNSFALTDYQTYTAWGGASGFYITGLTSNTTYKVKVKAMQGNFSETAYGPATSGVATVLPSLSFGVATSPPAGPPYAAVFTGLSPGSVFSANADAVISITSNAMLGGTIYIKDSSSGLVSVANSYTLNSATTDLTSAAKGYGALVTSLSQVSGGPLTAAAPFNGVSNNVGVLTSTLQLLASSTAPVTTGSITLTLKAKTDITVPSADDYTDVLTFIASMNF